MVPEKIEIIVDTNVPMSANGEATQASEDCAIACRNRLRRIMEEEVLLLDDEYLIWQEYRNNLDFSGQPGAGDRFFRWLWLNQANEQHCRIIPITPHPEREFAEFPQDPDLTSLDRSDRKFVAVALASGTAPEILNATDTDWWHHHQALRYHGVNVTFLCPELMQ